MALWNGKRRTQMITELDLLPCDVEQHQSALFLLLKEFDRVCKTLEIPYVLFAGSLLGAVRHQGFIPWDDDLDILMLRPDYERFLKEAPRFLDTKKYFLQKEFSLHWPMFFSKLRMNGTACIEKFHPKDRHTHQGIYIDLFPCDNTLPRPMLRRLQFFASKIVIAKSLGARGYDTDSVLKKIFIVSCRIVPLGPFLRFAKLGKDDSACVSVFFGASRRYRCAVFPREWIAYHMDVPFAEGIFPIPKQFDMLLKTLYGNYMLIPSEEERICKKHAILVDLDHSWEEYSNLREDMKFQYYTRSIR